MDDFLQVSAYKLTRSAFRSSLGGIGKHVSLSFSEFVRFARHLTDCCFLLDDISYTRNRKLGFPLGINFRNYRDWKTMTVMT